ncbi:N-acetylmuramoyl-L-alanine amidase [Streptomyces alkaliphilus]|uniref:N-acetylmuramoyl-L-alanine amidase n=1 Tax=Streptomyces alkaliphilus TaxID=1472722 RepID=UPI001567BEAE|nr:N-acetylmuramoyl-L-alanine amidase [Streptomyces alkaliphilus]
MQGMADGSTPAEPTAADPSAAVAEPETHEADLARAAGGTRAELPRTATDPFSLIGVTWTDPETELVGTVEARVRAASGGAWSSWLELEPNPAPAAWEDAERGGTEPLWVGPSDGIEVRVVSEAGISEKLPAGLRVDMIDPGAGTARTMGPAAFARDETSGDAGGTPAPGMTPGPLAEPVDTVPGSAEVTAEATGEPAAGATVAPLNDPAPTDPAPTDPAPSDPAPSDPAPTTPAPDPTVSVPPAPPSTAPRPPIVSRAQWGADEAATPLEAIYLPDPVVKAVVVHHTAESNAYTCENSAAVVRGIFTYHVRTLGWRDIGYNFLVDKCGTIHEGRKGGVDRPVYGAHAYGFNDQTTGIAVLGTYTDTAAPTAVLNSVARLSAWKLGQYGADPTGTVGLVAGADGVNLAGQRWSKGAVRTLPRIHGHRDGYNTLCPGDRLYGQLATIRTLAGGAPSALALNGVTGTTAVGTTHYTRNSATIAWKTGTPSQLLTRFEVLVDGKVAVTTAGNARSAAVTLTPGTRQVSVRGVHLSGRTATTPAVTVVADTTAPTFTTAPRLALRAGTVNTDAVPVRLTWKAADETRLQGVRLLSPVARSYSATTTSADLTAKSGSASTWQVRALDTAGNQRTVSPSFTPVILQETAAKRTGTWTTRSDSRYLGGKSLASGTKNSSLTWTFTGRSAALVVSRASGSGQVRVYVDGKLAKTVDLKSSTVRYRDAIWTQSWTSNAKHTVRIEVVGTSGRPTITVDALTYIK